VQAPTPKDPFEDEVSYDEVAAHDAARRMGAAGAGDKAPFDAHGHDPRALREAAKRMGSGSTEPPTPPPESREPGSQITRDAPGNAPTVRHTA
jgi:hypothetical protein